MADDRTQLDQPGDENDKTEAMNKPSRRKSPSKEAGSAESAAPTGSDAEEPKKGVKGRDEWQTVQQPKAPRPAAIPPPAAPASESAARPGTPAASAPLPGASAMPPAQGSQNPAVPPNAPPIAANVPTGIPLGAQMANMGIKSPTAQWVTLGAGAFVLLCCGCSCIGGAVSFLPSLLGQ